MKKFKRFISIVAMLALVTAMLAGCGKDTNKHDSDDDDSSSAFGKNLEEELEAELDDALNDAFADLDDDTEAVDEVAEEVDNRTPIQKFWGGDWYGIMWFTGANGNYSEYNNFYWDAMATIDVDESGNADMLIWYEVNSKDDPVSHVQLTISEASGSGEMGAAISESGWMLVDSDSGNGDIKHADWIIDPMTDVISSKYGNDMIHIEGDYEDGDGEIYYHFFLRKWGTLWEDVAADPEMLVPGYYEDWYKPLVASGASMPDTIGGTATATADSGDSTGDSGDTDTSTGASTGGGSYDGSRMVLVDNEYCTIVVNGTGCNPYNDSWIGYMFELTNKADFSICFSSYANPNLGVQTLDSLGTGDTCTFNGAETKTHFKNVINAGATMDNACLAIDGVTDASQLGNAHGYICYINNETGEVLGNIEYSF